MKKAELTGTLTVLAALVVAVGALVLAGARPAEAAFPGTNGQIVYGGPSFTDGKAVSADGSKVAYAVYDSFWGSTIWVRNFDGSKPRRLTDLRVTCSGAARWDVDPSWSPDGSRIVFGSDRCGTDEDVNPYLYVMNSDGTGQARITSGISDYALEPSWSPDGSRIVYEAGRFSGDQGIYAIDPDGSDKTFLASGAEPAWSPDGSRIVFTRDGGIYTVGRDGANETRVDAGGAGSSKESPVWSPDGRKIAYYDRCGQDCTGPYVMDADGSNPTKIPGASPRSQPKDWQPLPRCTVVGGPGDNRLVGTQGRDVACGLGGDDTLAGLGGDDILIGGTGDDTFSGGAGEDILNGGGGTDTVSYVDASTPVGASLTTDYARGVGPGSDLLSYVENLAGTRFADRLTGTSFNPNVLRGLGGNDTLNARDGRGGDVADGGTGNDSCRKDATDRVANCP